MGPRRYVPNLGPATIVASGLTVPVLTTSVADYNEVYDALAGLHRKFPVRSLRRLKEHVYRLVLEKEPVATLYTQDLEADTDVAKIEVAIGVGAVDRIHQRGYRAINRLDLVDDILNDDGNFDPGSVVRYALPQLLKSTSNVPLYKYLRAAGYLTEDGRLRREEELDYRVIKASRSIRQRLRPPTNYRQTAGAVLAAVRGFNELRERGGILHVLYYGALLPNEDMDTTELLFFLKDQRGRVDRYPTHISLSISSSFVYTTGFDIRAETPKDITARCR
jgi:hypothetical protein